MEEAEREDPASGWLYVSVVAEIRKTHRGGHSASHLPGIEVPGV